MGMHFGEACCFCRFTFLHLPTKWITRTFLLLTLVSLPDFATGFVAPASSLSSKHSPSSSKRLTVSVEEQTAVGGRQEKAKLLKENILDIADHTQRGFAQSSTDRETARRCLFELAKYNPTAEPAEAYYGEDEKTSIPENGTDGSSVCQPSEPSLRGKWTLVYTDAPDITSLGNTNPWASLGRIGQECDPPYIKNVIEWKRPEWTATLPFSGPNEARILQKVVTVASSSPDQPTLVNLDLAGLQAETPLDVAAAVRNSNLLESIRDRGLIAGLLQSRPLNLQGPLQAPFGTFEILYLDDEMRAIKTGQNFVAVNLRIRNAEEEWF